MQFDPKDPGLRRYGFVRYVPGVLSAARCAAIIADAEARGFDEAPITTLAGPVMRRDVRSNTRVMYDDVALAAELWQAVRPFTPERVGRGAACGLNERFRIYRYDPSQQFDWHRDGAYERNPSEYSWLTLLFYLNAGYTGGRTEFQQSAVEPTEGGALLFAHHMAHRGAPVETGRKYVLRTDVMYRLETEPAMV